MSRYEPASVDFVHCACFRAVSVDCRPKCFSCSPGAMAESCGRSEVPSGYVLAEMLKHPPSYSSEFRRKPPGWPRLASGFLVGQTVTIARDIQVSLDTVVKQGRAATVVGPPETRTQRNRREKVACVELVASAGSSVDCRKFDVHLRDVQFGLPGPYKKNELVVLAKGLHDGHHEVAPQYSDAEVWGRALSKPESHICVRVLNRPPDSSLVEVALADLLPCDPNRHEASLGSEMRVDMENAGDDFHGDRVGTQGWIGTLVEQTTCVVTGATHVTLRFKSGQKCTYDSMWLTWLRRSPKYLVRERKGAASPSHSKVLKQVHTKVLESKRLLEQACLEKFGEEVPRAFQAAVAELAGAEAMLVDCKRSAHSMMTRLGKGNKKKLGQLKRFREQLVQVAGNTSEAKRRKAYEDSENFTVSWKTGRKPCSKAKHDAGVKGTTNFQAWYSAKQKAKDALNIQGKCNFKKGTKEYQKALEFLNAYKEMQ